MVGAMLGFGPGAGIPDQTPNLAPSAEPPQQHKIVRRPHTAIVVEISREIETWLAKASIVGRHEQP